MTMCVAVVTEMLSCSMYTVYYNHSMLCIFMWEIFVNLSRFEQVPLVTPNGDVLVNELNFEVCTLSGGALFC